MKTRLYIEDREVELNSSVTFALTKTFEDLHDPTAIINDWSKTVSIPFTNKNHAIFGNSFRVDRRVVSGGAQNVGMDFDPTKKASFRLYVGPSLVMTGYAKLTSIKRVSGRGSYEVNLFGQLGDVLQQLSAMTPDDLSTRTYTVNRELIKTAWEQDLPDMTKALANCTDTEIVGWSCSTQGLYEDNFDSKTIELADETTKTLESVLQDKYGEDSTMNISGLIGDGISPRARGEYRSYYQIPFLYIPRFFQMLQSACSTLTGYTMNLNEVWFSQTNAYYNNLVMMLQRLNLKPSTVKTNNYTMNLPSRFYVCDGTTGLYTPSAMLTQLELAVVNEEEPILNGATLNIPSGELVRTSGQLALLIRTSSSVAMESNQGLVVTLWIRYPDGGYKKASLIWCAPSTTLDTSAYTNVFQTASPSNALPSTDPDYVSGYNTFRVAVDAIAGTASTGGFSFFYTWNWVDTTTHVYTDGSTAETLVFSDYSSSNIAATIEEYKRSNARVTLADMWGDRTPFEMMLQYCKMFGLLIQVDDTRKTITIAPRTEFFSAGPAPEDWSNKIDMSRDFSIKPLSFETKYMVMDTTSETDRGEAYAEKYGVGYGGIRIVQPYDFNTETTELFKDVVAPVITSENVLSWNDIYSGEYAWKNSEPMIYARNDNKPVNIFGAMFFHNGLYSFDTNQQSVYVSDDSVEQTAQNTYCYYQQGTSAYAYMTAVTTYPGLDIVLYQGGEWTNKLATFGVPAVRYDSTKTYNDRTGIYARYWSAYLSERYSIQTKVVQCYLWLTPVDYAQFNFNKMVTIDGVLYMINKISDYDPTVLGPTKCELVSVIDLEAYLTTVRQLYKFDGDTLVSLVAEDSYNSSTYTVTFALYGEMRGNKLVLPATLD